MPIPGRSGGNQSSDSDPSLLSIVQSQRERFRLRVQELENENSSQAANIGSLTQEIENLRLDNVKLYEKIKFLQNYRPNSANSAYQVRAIESTETAEFELFVKNKTNFLYLQDKRR